MNTSIDPDILNTHFEPFSGDILSLISIGIVFDKIDKYFCELHLVMIIQTECDEAECALTVAEAWLVVVVKDYEEK